MLHFLCQRRRLGWELAMILQRRLLPCHAPNVLVACPLLGLWPRRTRDSECGNGEGSGSARGSGQPKRKGAILHILNLLVLSGARQLDRMERKEGRPTKQGRTRKKGRKAQGGRMGERLPRTTRDANGAFKRPLSFPTNVDLMRRSDPASILVVDGFGNLYNGTSRWTHSGTASDSTDEVA